MAHQGSDIQKTAADEQDERVVSDSWEDVIAGHMEGKNQSSVRDIWIQALFGKIGELTRANEIRIGIACKRLGLERVRDTVVDDEKKRRPWVYRRP